MNPIYIQLGIAVWLELARRRAEKDKDTMVADALDNLITAPEAPIAPKLLPGIVAYLTDIAEDILKAVKP